MNDPWWLAGGVDPANCVAAYQPIGAASLEASYINLANPDQGTYNAKPVVAPTFNAITGWIFNGSTQYLNTGIVPNTSAWSMIASFLTSNNSQAYLGYVGFSGERRFYLVGRASTGTNRYGCGGGSEVIGSATNLTSGVMAIANLACYLNGQGDGAGTINWSSGASQVYIGSLNRDGSSPIFGGGTFCAIAVYNTTLTHPQVVAITNAMNALTGASLPTHHMPSAGMRRWAKLYSQQGFIPAWARNSNRIITPGIQLP